MNDTGSYYNLSDGGAADAARLKLCLFDEATVRDIVTLVNRRGMGLLDDCFRNTTPADPPRVLAIVGPEYMKYGDMASVLMGLSTMILDGLRKPKMGPDEYADMLEGAFGLPTLLARYYANQIESYDKIVGDANADGSAEFTERVIQLSNTLQEGARRLVNGLAASMGVSTLVNWDQNQTYDIDFLDELSSLGEIVMKLNRRNRLMIAQAMIKVQMNLMATGDIEGNDPSGDVVGDVFGALGRRSLPPSIMGNLAPLAGNSRAASITAGEQLLQQAGLAVEGNTIKARSHGNRRLRNAIEKVFAGRPLLSTLRRLIPGHGKHHLADPQSGDPMSRVYGDVTNDYGDAVADAWASGDIDSVVANYLKTGDIGNGPLSTDETAAGDVEVSDIGDFEPEVGGLLLRARTRAANKRATRREGRTERKATKTAAKVESRQNLADAKAAARVGRSNEDALDAELPDSAADNAVDQAGLDFSQFM